MLCSFTLEQLIAFRYSCKRFNNFVLLHESAIIRGALNSGVYGSTAATFYNVFVTASSRTFKTLLDIARRCSIAWETAHPLAQCRSASLSCLYYDLVRFGERQAFTPVNSPRALTFTFLRSCISSRSIGTALPALCLVSAPYKHTAVKLKGSSWEDIMRKQ